MTHEKKTCRDLQFGTKNLDKHTLKDDEDFTTPGIPKDNNDFYILVEYHIVQDNVDFPMSGIQHNTR